MHLLFPSTFNRKDDECDIEDGWIDGWGGINVSWYKKLDIFRNGSTTNQKFADEILRPCVVSYAIVIGDLFLSMHDNVKNHRVRHTGNTETEKLQPMKWASCSSDLKFNWACLEHVRTAHYNETSASVLCLGLRDCTSWRVEQTCTSDFRSIHGYLLGFSPLFCFIL